MRDIMQDIRFAFRTLRKSPGFTVIAITTIALGIGAGSAVFSMVEGVLIKRLPYRANAQLVRLEQPTAKRPDAGFSVLEVKDYREQVHSFAQVAEYHSMAFLMFGLGEPQRVQTGVVSDNFFTLLGVTPLYGRTFLPGEEAVGAAPVVVLSYEYWRTQFGGDPTVVGKTFSMNDHVHTVVGVLPPLPVYPNANDIWMPAGACPFRSSPGTMANRRARLLQAFALLKPGASLVAARSEMKAVSDRLHASYPDAFPAAQQFGTSIVSLRDELTSGSRPLFLSLLAMAGFVMLVAAANFANLTLARQLRRSREIAVRAALGASRGRVYRQLATESLIVTLAGGLLGLAIARGGLGLLRSLATHVTPRAGEIRIDPVVLAGAIGVSVLVGLIAALVPLRQAGRSVGERLRSSLTTTSNRRDIRVRDGLVAVQVTVAFMLLVAAGLMVRSVLALEHVDGGYDRAKVLTARVSLNFTKYATHEQARDFGERLAADLRGQPGVTAVALASDFPMNVSSPSSQPFQVDGQPAPVDPSAGPQSDVSVVSEDYFKVIGVPVLQGRAFTPQDRDTVNYAVVIGQRLARTYWTSGTALGSRLSIDKGVTWHEIIGVVSDVRQNGLSQDLSDEIYVPAAANPIGDIRVLVRSAGDPAALGKVIRNAVYAIDPQQAIASVQTLNQLRGAQLSEPRVTAALLAAFAILALAITAGGLGGVVATGVTQRITEVGIRLALGATRTSVLWLVVRQALAIVIIGLGLGFVGALISARVLSALLYHVQPTDALTYSGVGVALLAVGTIACVVPARRALRIEPVEAMRVR